MCNLFFGASINLRLQFILVSMRDRVQSYIFFALSEIGGDCIIHKTLRIVFSTQMTQIGLITADFFNYQE